MEDKNSQILRLGIAGLGGAARQMIPAAKKHPKIKITAAADVDKDALNAFVNDSKATNVGATIAAIDSLATETQNLIVIAGGDAKGADLNPLKPYLQKHVKALICFGKDAKKLVALSSKSHLTNNMSEAVNLAKQLSSPGNVVLLAPACASIDMYNNYMQRGDDFVKCVLADNI